MELVEVNNQSQVLTRQQTQQPASTSLISAERLESLQKDREIHKYKTIWTKDAHGGPYKKVRFPICVDRWCPSAKYSSAMSRYFESTYFDLNMYMNFIRYDELWVILCRRMPKKG